MWPEKNHLNPLLVLINQNVKNYVHCRCTRCIVSMGMELAVIVSRTVKGLFSLLPYVVASFHICCSKKLLKICNFWLFWEIQMCSTGHLPQVDYCNQLRLYVERLWLSWFIHASLTSVDCSSVTSLCAECWQSAVLFSQCGARQSGLSCCVRSVGRARKTADRNPSA